VFVRTLTPHFNNLDIYNHANNAVYLTNFEEAHCLHASQRPA